MNQKKVRYFLTGGVALVWGLIIYRVIAGLSQDDELPPISNAGIRPVSQAPVNDSFVLIADYPDPFLVDEDTVAGAAVLAVSQSGNAQANNQQPAQASINTAAPAAPVGYVEGTIQYMGSISNPDKKLTIATITLKGKELFVKEKEKVEEYTIVKILPESLEFIYKGKKVVVRKG